MNNLKPGQDLDIVIATEVMGIHAQQPKKYSQNMEAAWDVVQKLGITLIPIEDGSWFAMVGTRDAGWRSPAEFIECMQKGDFMRSGAAVSETAPLSVCLAALSAVEKRKQLQADFLQSNLN